MVSTTSIRTQLLELRLCEGIVLPAEVATPRAPPLPQLAGGGGGGATEVAELAVTELSPSSPEPMSEVQWLGVEALLGLLVVERFLPLIKGPDGDRL